MDDSQNQKRISRRWFLSLAGMVCAWLLVLGRFLKNPKAVIQSLRVSFHPARFYKKLD